MNDIGPTEQKPQDHLAAERFLAMSERVTANFGGTFGGALVIAPPGGEIVEIFALDSTQNAALFWSHVKSLADIALANLDQQDRQLRPGMAFR